jgi:hypothetical protein
VFRFEKGRKKLCKLWAFGIVLTFQCCNNYVPSCGLVALFRLFSALVIVYRTSIML